jgi:hypothetical protein
VCVCVSVCVCVCLCVCVCVCVCGYKMTCVYVYMCVCLYNGNDLLTVMTVLVFKAELHRIVIGCWGLIYFLCKGVEAVALQSQLASNNQHVLKSSLTRNTSRLQVERHTHPFARV